MRKVLLAVVAAALAVTPASAEKMTMLCGNLEVLVVVKRNPNTSRWTKIDIYPADPNTTMTTEDKQLEVKEGMATSISTTKNASPRCIGFALLMGAHADGEMSCAKLS